jgi:hypothetical protein
MSQSVRDEACADVNNWLETISVPVYIHREIPNGYGFPTFRVFEVCASPTETVPITWSRWEDLKATIYVKSSTSYTDVVCLHDDGKEKENMVIFAFRVFPDLCDAPLAEMSPVDIVKRFADRFGVTISVGGQSAKFFWEQEIPRPTILLPGEAENTIFRLDSPKKTSLANGFLFRIDPSLVHIAMAFCIDTSAYLEWAKSH